jgi:type I restriction enzyme, S subunit
VQNVVIREGYKLTEVGVIPEDWEVIKFGENYAEPSRNGIYKSPEYHGKGTRIVNMGEMFGLDFISNQEMSRVSLTSKEIAITGLREGDLLFGRRSVVPSGAGKCSIVISPIEALTFESSIIRVRLKYQEVSSLFHYYFFSSSLGRATMSNIISGTNIKGIRGTELRDLKISLPPLSEQRLIATALFDMDELLGGLDRLIAKKRDLKQATMQQLLTGKTRLPSFGEGKGYKKTQVGLIPEDWDVKPLKVVSTMSGRIGWQGLKQEEFTTNDTDPFLITGMNFKEGKIRWNEVYHIPEPRYQEDKNIQLKDGDILMTKDGTIGKILYVEDIPFPGKASLNSHLLVFRPLNWAYDPKFLFYQLISKKFTDYIDLNKSGSTFFGITQEAVGNYGAYLPPLPEQTAIATILSDMDTEIATLEQRRNKTQQLKQGMMQELLTGRIRLV